MDEKLTAAIKDVFESETDYFIAQLDEAPHEFSGSFEASARKLIRRRKASYYPLISSLGRRVITAAAAAAVMCGSVMTAASVRDTTSELEQSGSDGLYQMTIDSDVAEHYPRQIEKEYVLTAVPEGFEVSTYKRTECKVRTVYTGSGGEYIIFYQYTKSAFYSSFSYDGQEIFTDENDRQYICYYISGESLMKRSVFYWDDGEYVFELSSSIGRQELFEVCKSLEIKE